MLETKKLVFKLLFSFLATLVMGSPAQAYLCHQIYGNQSHLLVDGWSLITHPDKAIEALDDKPVTFKSERSRAWRQLLALYDYTGRLDKRDALFDVRLKEVTARDPFGQLIHVSAKMRGDLVRAVTIINQVVKEHPRLSYTAYKLQVQIFDSLSRNDMSLSTLETMSRLKALSFNQLAWIAEAKMELLAKTNQKEQFQEVFEVYENRHMLMQIDMPLWVVELQSRINTDIPFASQDSVIHDSPFWSDYTFN